MSYFIVCKRSEDEHSWCVGAESVEYGNDGLLTSKVASPLAWRRHLPGADLIAWALR